MAGADPHIHVDRKVVGAGADMRNVMASTLGSVPDTPAVVTTGCGIDVPYAMTSPDPDKVTCLPCREYARDEYLRFAQLVERLGAMPAGAVTAADIGRVAAWSRDRARRFVADA